jgi:hypothetical protein
VCVYVCVSVFVYLCVCVGMLLEAVVIKTQVNDKYVMRERLNWDRRVADARFHAGGVGMCVCLCVYVCV